MRSKFHIAFQHDLIIDSNGPQNAMEDPSRTVHMQIDKFAPKPRPDGSPSMGHAAEDFECIFSAQIKPSEARTIASALMTAAQNAR